MKSALLDHEGIRPRLPGWARLRRLAGRPAWALTLLALLVACAGGPPAIPDKLTPAPSVPPSQAVSPMAPTATATPKPAWPAAEPPPVLYLDNTRVMALNPGDQPEVVADLANQGPVRAVLALGADLLLLREYGLQQVDLAAGAGWVMVPFDVPVLYGELSVWGTGAFYAATTSSATSASGFATQLGAVERARHAHRVLRTDDRPLRLLGPSADGQHLYVQPVGQDPSFGPLWQLSVETGDLERELPTQGEDLTALAPDGRTFATLHRRPGQADQPTRQVLALYDLEAEPVASREFELPVAGAVVGQMLWSPDSRQLYFTLVAGEGGGAQARGVWHLEVQTGKLAPAVDSLGGKSAALTHGGRWLLARFVGECSAALLDLQTGVAKPLVLPAPALLTPELASSQWEGQLSPDGQWLLTGVVPTNPAWLVHLPTGVAAPVELPPGALPLPWPERWPVEASQTAFDCSRVEHLAPDSAEAQQVIRAFVASYRAQYPTEYMGFDVVWAVDRLGGYVSIQGMVTEEEKDIIVVRRAGDRYELLARHIALSPVSRRETIRAFFAAEAPAVPPELIGCMDLSKMLTK